MTRTQRIGAEALEAFVAPIAAALGKEAPTTNIAPFDSLEFIPPHVTDGLTQEQLIERFITECDLLGIELAECDRAELPLVIAQLVDNNGGGPVMLPSYKEMMLSGIAEHLGSQGNLQIDWWLPTNTREENIALANAAHIGVTFPQAAIAETGTILQACSAECGRSISLLPSVHFAIIRESTIVASMKDVLVSLSESVKEGKQMRSQVCFISGPSNTADIELVRVEGVHGPTKVCYILVRD